MYKYILTLEKGDKFMTELIYQATNKYGITYQNFDRESVMSWYERNEGTKIISKTKDLFPVINVIAEKHIDVNNLREDDTLNITTVAQRRAILKYDKKTAKGIYLKLNKETDKEIIEFLEHEENKQGLIKELILKEMERRKK